MTRPCRKAFTLDTVVGTALIPVVGVLPAGVLVLGGQDVLTGGCVQATQTYALETAKDAGHGSVQVERIEGEQWLLVLQLDELPPPESLAPDVRMFAVWLQDSHGRTVKAGLLRYDRARRAGHLLVTTEFSPFTVQVTGERDALASAPSGVLLAERQVSYN